MSVERRRRREDRKAPNHERWVISYADFVTLLLATFTVLYAISSINVTKYRAVAGSLSAVFAGKSGVQRSGNGAESHGPFDDSPAPVRLPVTKPSANKGEKKNEAKADTKINGKIESRLQTLPLEVREQVTKLDDVYQHLNTLLKDMIDKGEVHMSFKGLNVVIDINASVLFESGKAELTPESLDTIDKIGGVLKNLSYNIQVSGYTDDAPIHTAQFDSNWELSAVRAISVVKRFIVDGIEPTRLIAAGYGEYHPIASNAMPEGMAQNRRVAIVVSPSDGETAHISDPSQLGGDAGGSVNDRAGSPHPPVAETSPGAPQGQPSAFPASP